MTEYDTDGEDAMDATGVPLSDDPLWPRAAAWFTARDLNAPLECDFALLGVPAFRTSLSATGAAATPAAVRMALARYSTWAASRAIDIGRLIALDYGDVPDPDGTEGEQRVATAVAAIAKRAELVVVIGGDNSITYSAARGVFSGALETCGLVTVDAHHDLRDGENNGSPVRRLIEAGVSGTAVVQIGIADFSNSAAYTRRAQELGIVVVSREALRGADLRGVVARALDVAGGDGRPVYVDLDVDVCDRSAVPGCPAAAPGGISADELRQLAFLFASDPRVCAIDITEVDATADSADERTTRLAALLVLEAAAGLAAREDR